ncbi:GrlR family regulatory protein [Xanthomonas campestris pv. raphani]|nr:GrlR family regulatory protein [Xanthomonas campestris]MEA9733981.1 GrlR family regulatory protein [Xanthomonas campestris pv. raphani]
MARVKCAALSPYSRGEGVNGGDSGCTYSGSKRSDDAGFTAKLTIKRWDPGSQSVLGGLDQLELVFRGDTTASGFTAKGSIVGRSDATLVVEGRYLAPAV